MKKLFVTLVIYIIFFLIAFFIAKNVFSGLPIIPPDIVTYIVIFFSVSLSLQSVFTLVWMLYAWENPETVNDRKSPTTYTAPSLSFTALIAARHEENVISETILAVDKINYPEALKEIIVLCRADDVSTIDKARRTVLETGKVNIRVVTFDGFPINKPYALNIGIKLATTDIVCVFDAEDEPHEEIYNIVNTVMNREHVDVVQSGVQLMNFKSSWFSSLNCMEYYFWFKSGLHFFSKIAKVTPLGGNTVFFKREYLNKVNGWDDNCLTEDADIGFRLIEAGAKVKVIYDEEHSTREETPSEVGEFIKQRTRWNQGFLQILFKNNWSSLPLFKQKMTAFYILMSPILQAMLLIYIPFAILVAFTVKMPVVVSLFSFVPLLLLCLQISTQMVGIYEFTKSYHLKFPIYMPLVILLTYFPYQLLLMIGAFRGGYRFVFNKNAWEKTLHVNAHRQSQNLMYDK